jgi:S-DNA-T family DNA segregation ATPase FtsK/SpoIIIE
MEDYDNPDELLEDAITILKSDGEIRSSTLQRRLKLGYHRAYRIMNQLAERGLIEEYDSTRVRGDYKYLGELNPKAEGLEGSKNM